MKYTNSHVVIPGLTGNLLSIWKVLPLAAVVVLLAACGDDPKVGGTEEDAGIIAIENKTVSGVSQKGPFVNGSSVTIQALNGETLAQTGRSYQGKIKNDQGEFSVSIESLVSPYVVLKANGFYRNENTGEKSKAPVELFALSDISNRDEVNVNLLTHLEYERSLYLASVDSMTVAAAKKQAEKEVLTSFGIEGDFKNSEDLNIFGTDDGAAALLAISVLMQGDLSEADFTERLNDYAFDIEKDGEWDDQKTATVIADWASSISLNGKIADIRGNIIKWQLSSDIPAFEKYVDNFWWQNYGLGICDKEHQSDVKTNSNALSVSNGIHFICDNKAWRLATDLEKDTYKWEDGDDADIKLGDVIKSNCYVFEDRSWRAGNANDCSLGLRGCTALRQDTVGLGSDKVWHICDAQSWRNATTYEKDTFEWADSTDGAIKKGNVTDTIYVFDKTAWRTTNNVEAKLGGCVSAIADSVGKVGSTYYICKSNRWVEASAIEYDTYRWAAGKDGDSKPGSVNTNNCYVYENSIWRNGVTKDCSLGLRGCTTLRQDTVGFGADNIWYKCVSKNWRTATNIEKDTAAWGAGAFDGEVRTGQINKTTYYIYGISSNAWRNATTIEKDTYDYANNTDWTNGADGEIKKGAITDTIYVFDVTIWRIADDIEKVLGGCVASIQDSVGKAGNIYYICKPRNWVVATTLQYDTYKQECSRFGQIIHGNVNTDYAYFCYGEEWKRFYGNESITYEKLVDERDGHIYRTVQIGTQTWMAENLNYADEKNYPSMIGRNWCMSDKDSCEKYGRLYTWGASIDSVFWSSQGMTCGFDLDPEELQCNLPDTILGICPSGWHIPSIAEWNTLYTSLGSDYKAMQAKGVAEWVKATDAFGFTALPAGFYYEGSNYEFFHDVGSYADFWSSGEYDNERATSWILINYRAGFSYTFWYYGKEYGTSVRCVKDGE